MTYQLTIDTGNSQVCMVLFEDEHRIGQFRFDTRPFKTPAQLLHQWNTFLAEHDLTLSDVHLTISSVVPDFHLFLNEAAQTCPVLSYHWVNSDSPHQFQLDSSVRKEIGADLISGLVGARSMAKGPLVVIDCGTATTLALLDKRDSIVGVAILPGIVTQIRTLTDSAPHLPDTLDLKTPRLPYGVNTVEALQSGILYGHAEMIEGFVRRYQAMFEGEALSVFACGGLFRHIADLCPNVEHHTDILVNVGCRVLGNRSLP